MPTLLSTEFLKKASEQDRKTFFYNSIVAKLWGVEILEHVLLHPNETRLLTGSVFVTLQSVAATQTQLESIVNMMDFGGNAAANQIANRYRNLSIVERIQQVGSYRHNFEAASGSRSHDLILEQHNKDNMMFANIHTLVEVYSFFIYEANENPVTRLELLQRILTDIKDNNIPRDNNGLVKMFAFIRNAIEDPTQKAEFDLLFKFSLERQIIDYAGLHKTRKFLVSLHAEVNKKTWNSMKKIGTILGNGQTPKGIQTFRATLSDLPKTELTNTVVKTLFSSVVPTLEAKGEKKTLSRRSEPSNTFYVTTRDEARKINTSEFKPYHENESRFIRRG